MNLDNVKTNLAVEKSFEAMDFMKDYLMDDILVMKQLSNPGSRSSQHNISLSIIYFHRNKYCRQLILLSRGNRFIRVSTTQVLMKKRFAPCHGLPFPLTISLITFGLFVSGCQNELNLKAESSVTRNSTTAPVPKATHEAIKVNNAAAILALRQVPILCYHQVRDWRPTDSKVARTYIVPPAAFQEQMKALADAGYQTILPNELYHYLLQGKTIPAKSVMLTFDDSDLDQYTVALPEMNKYGFKGAFFIMTVSLGRPNYMTKMQVKELADAGHTIGSHTWDHHSVKQYSGKDWAIQIEKPTQQLESITGKPVEFFAYPFGLWNKNAIPELKKRGFTAAFQLAAKRDEQEPLFTIRRIIVPGSWSGEQLTRAMVNSF